VAFGSWFVSAYIGNDMAWEAVITGKVLGFSVEGMFKYIPVKAAMSKMTYDQKLELIKRILEAEES
jgi:hypothetical protein